MKTFRVIRIVACLVVILVLGGVLVYGVRNSGINWGGVSLAMGDAKLVKSESAGLEGIENIELGFTYHDMHIYEGTGNEIRIEQYDSKGDLEDDMLFTLSRDGNALKIGVRQHNRAFILFGAFQSRIDVYLPPSYAKNIDVRTTSGTLSIEHAFAWANTALSSNSGSVRAEFPLAAQAFTATATSGTVSLDAVTATTAIVKSNSGSLRIASIAATGDVELSATSGSVRAESVSGANVTASSNSGTVAIDEMNALGNANLSATSGSVRAEAITAAGNARIGSNSGTLKISSLSCKVYEMSTSSGGISIESLRGSGTATSSSGSVHITLDELTGDAAFSTTSGSVNVTPGSGVACTFHATTTSGGIHASYPLSIDREREKQGTIGSDPQHTLELRSTSGSVRLGS